MTDVILSNQSRFIKFSLLVIFAIASIICSLYIAYNFLKNSSFRRRFQNQTLFILVFLVLLSTIFNIPTTFRYVLSRLSRLWNLVLLTVFSPVDTLCLKVKIFVIFGKLSIIFLLHVLCGAKRYLLSSDISLYSIQIIFFLDDKN